ncbi:MAG: hypothetical protein HKO66_13785 [Saprospiraceae bacterium]|nr:sulfotransferase domain-containing protein [Bacteroidia bacterium]NNL93306.1 hypothetical protein [Saprospiraceae bacterium]
MTKNQKKYKIQIFGERCSGTNYLELLINNNFHDAQVKYQYGFKHLFKNDGLKKPIDEKFKGVVIFRNPFDWLRSLHKLPHHAPEMMDISFSQFIRKPWRTYMGPEWISASEKERQSIMIPERLKESFENVFALRKYKIQTFKSFSQETDDIMYIRYEDLIQNPNDILKQIGQKFGLSKRSEFINISTYKKTDKKFKKNRYPNISKQDLAYILENLDWKQENDLKYFKSDYKSSYVDHIYYLATLFISKLKRKWLNITSH